jgi:hypothetical protein
MKASPAFSDATENLTAETSIEIKFMDLKTLREDPQLTGEPIAPAPLSLSSACLRARAVLENRLTYMEESNEK